MVLSNSFPINDLFPVQFSNYKYHKRDEKYYHLILYNFKFEVGQERWLFFLIK